MSRRIRLFVSLLSLVLAGAAQAQTPPRTPTPNDTLVSPLIHGGNVTLQIYAPNAERVFVTGDWMTARAPLDLENAGNGVWSVTLTELRPDYYSYTFNVDGVATLDPKNPEIKQGIRGVDNMFYLQGRETRFQDNRKVPHGQIRKVWYDSATLGMQRRMHVYTPPGYDDSDRDYPVFYLLHGGGDEDSGWSTIGRAGFIIDNLLASGDAEPMIVVMPNGSLPAVELADDASPAEQRAAQFRFERELMNDVMPVVERSFRVDARPSMRAIAGLSMGGGHTTQVFGLNPEEFAYASIWSAGIFSGDVGEFEATYADFLSRADEVNNGTKYLSVVAGTDDFAHPGAVALSEALDKHGIEHEFIETGGGHTWLNWRQYLHDYAKVLFK